MEVDSIGGSQYFVTFIDGFLNWATVYPMKLKSETARCYPKFEKLDERHTGRKIRVLSCERGGENFSEFLQGSFDKAGIKNELTVAYSSHQSGVAEVSTGPYLVFFGKCYMQKSFQNIYGQSR